jgi:hypothetical protein
VIDGNALVRPPNTRYEALDNPVPSLPLLCDIGPYRVVFGLAPTVPPNAGSSPANSSALG